MGGKFQTTTPLKLHSRFTPKIHAYSWGEPLPKLLKNEKTAIFGLHFFFVFICMVPYGRECFK